MNVVVKLQGGLGNQMFQYAFGKNISDITNRKLILDLSFLNRRDLGPDFVYRNYDLDIFNLENVSVVNFYDGDYDLIIDNFNPNSTMDSINLNIKDILQNSSDTIYLDGYWSSPLYFNKIDFTFNESCLTYSNDLLFDIQNTNSVMLNIRRADFLNNDFHGTYGKDYILKGINKLKSNFSDLKFFIFSDDIEWCKNNILGEYVHYIENTSMFEDMCLMSLCDHNIIANSSFSWWASYLNETQNKMVVCPQDYIGSSSPSHQFMNGNYYPSDWIALPLH